MFFNILDDSDKDIYLVLNLQGDNANIVLNEDRYVREDTLRYLEKVNSLGYNISEIFRNEIDAAYVYKISK